MADYRSEAPAILREFLSYHETIKAHSQRTVDEYFLDLRNFFRYLKQTRDPALRDLQLDEIDIMDVDLPALFLPIHVTVLYLRLLVFLLVICLPLHFLCMSFYDMYI